MWQHSQCINAGFLGQQRGKTCKSRRRWQGLVSKCRSMLHSRRMTAARSDIMNLVLLSHSPSCHTKFTRPSSLPISSFRDMPTRAASALWWMAQQHGKIARMHFKMSSNQKLWSGLKWTKIVTRHHYVNCGSVGCRVNLQFPRLCAYILEKSWR